MSYLHIFPFSPQMRTVLVFRSPKWYNRGHLTFSEVFHTCDDYAVSEKKYFHLLFFPKRRINACYRNAHSTEGFCVVHSAKLWAAAARDTRQTGVRRTPSPPSWNWYPGRRAGQQVLRGGGRGSLAWGRQGETGPLPKGRETWRRKQRQQAGGVHVTKTDSRQTASVQRSWDRKGQSLLEERSWAAQGFVNKSGENWKASS